MSSLKLNFNVILTRTTPLLSTISWIIRPFFPITFPTKFLGTWIDSSLYSNNDRAFFTAASVYIKKQTKVQNVSINIWTCI